MIVKKTKKIKTYEEYPDGANVPHIHTEYKCFCKKGKIIETNVPGFEFFITLECEKCEEKYHPFIDQCGRKEWIVYPIDE